MSVYFIQGKTTKNIKIGYTSKDVRSRMSELQTASSEPLVCLKLLAGTQQDESRLHQQFKDSWAGSGEWFTPTPDLVEYISNLPKSDYDDFERAVTTPTSLRPNTSLDQDEELEDDSDDPEDDSNQTPRRRTCRLKNVKSLLAETLRQINDALADSEQTAAKRADLIMKKADIVLRLWESPTA